MPRGGNFRINAHKHLRSKIRFGESKHAEKLRLREKHLQENGNLKDWNPSRTDYIYSVNTLKSYQQSVDSFNKFLKENNLSREVRTPDQITKAIANQYFQQKQEQGQSVYSISKDMAALNKLTDYKLKLNKQDAGVQERSYKDIQNNRIERDYHKEYNPQNYQEGILLAQSFGCRRETIQGGDYQAKANSIYQNKDGQIMLRVIEKGGKYREIQALEQNKEDLKQTFKIEQSHPMNKEEFKKIYNNQDNNYLIEKYSNKIPTHALRREYAQQLYNELGKHKEELKNDYRGYDREVLKQVSENLGHNRIDVVVYNYLK